MHRNKKQGDDHLGKYNGLGGKMESSEDLFSSMQREIEEESGLKATSMQLRGTINWTGFGTQAQDWLGFIFLIDAYEGNLIQTCPEGDLEWILLEKIMELPMWEGDRFFLPMVFDNDPRPFHGYMPYLDGKPQEWKYRRG